jgi:hypothetical protein
MDGLDWENATFLPLTLNNVSKPGNFVLRQKHGIHLLFFLKNKLHNINKYNQSNYPALMKSVLEGIKD